MDTNNLTKVRTQAKVRKYEKNSFRIFEHFSYVRKRGAFTLIELLIVMAIILILGGVLAGIGRDLFSFNNFFSDALTTERDAETAMKMMTAEMRTASAASTGSYPIAVADPNSFAFYANIDGDALKERVQYYINGTDLKKSVVKPVGNPLTYSTTTAQENIRVILRGMVASTTAPLFTYYDRNYAGTSSPLVWPFNISLARHILVTLIIDANPSKPPSATVLSSRVSIRNLKDNY